LGCRKLLAGAFAAAALAAMTSGASAVTNGPPPCSGAAPGSSSITNVAASLYVQCTGSIAIPGKPLQSFGASAILRTTTTNAFYFLADRSNQGVDVVTLSTNRFTRLLKPTAGATTGDSLSFMGQLIWTYGTSTTDTTRIGTIDESHSGPNGMAIFTDTTVTPNTHWLMVADGGCNDLILNNIVAGQTSAGVNSAATLATPSSAGTMGACGTAADPSTVPNPVETLLPCLNTTSPQPPPITRCYPVQHQPNVKLFNLQTNANVTTAGWPVPTGGGPAGPAPSGVYPFGNYAPGTPLIGQFGASKANDVELGHTTIGGDRFWMLVSSPNEPFVSQVVSATTPFTTTTCSAIFTTAGTLVSFPYVTLYELLPNGTAPPTVVYRATIKADDTSASPLLTTGGPFGCDGNKSRPGNSYGAGHFKARTNGGGQFFVPLPNVMNNIPVNTTVPAASCNPPNAPAAGCGIGQANAPNVAPPLQADTGIGCYFPKATPAATNLVNQPNNPVNGAWFWDCDGGLLYIDPLALEAAGGFTGANQPQIAPFITQTGVASVHETFVPGPIVVGTTSLAVVKLPYCSPGIAGVGRFGGDSSTVTDPAFNNLFLGCNPAFNGGTISTGSPVSIAETYSLLVNVAEGSIQSIGSVTADTWYAPGPFPATDPNPPFSGTVAFQNPGDSGIVPATPGCQTQSGSIVVPPTATTVPVKRLDCPGPINFATATLATSNGVQVPGGQILGFPFANTLFANGVTSVRLVGVNSGGEAAFTKDPHYYAAVGARFFSSANVTNLATRTPVLAYIDALSNLLVEFTPTSSGSNTVAFDDQYFRAYVPVNGVITPKLPAGDFTGNGIKLCGNATIGNNGVTTGPGCVVYFRQQHLSN
jgi:hypothetical protein